MKPIARATTPGTNGFLFALGVTTAVACAGNPKALRPVPASQPATVSVCSAQSACNDTLTFQFLGGAGVLMQERNRSPAIMTGPSFSNPRLSRTLLPWFAMRPNEARINDGLSASDVSAVQAILVGHGHYDHLFDVSPIARTRATSALIFGNKTVFNMLQGDSAVAARVRNAEDDIATSTRVGRWSYVADRRWRVMPIASSHAPNLLGVTFVGGRRKTPRKSLPRTAYGYKMGTPIAWIIDFMGSDTVPRFRIFYQDAASKPQFNVLPPFAGSDKRTVDLAIICVGNWNHAPAYPDSLIVNIAPRHIALSHWDDFFRDPRKPVKVIALGDASGLSAKLDNKPGREHWSAVSPKGSLRIAF